MTHSGKKVYNAIRDKERGVEQDHNSLSVELQGYQSQINQLVQDREERFVRLATFYLPVMDAESVRSTIRELQGEVQRLFKEKQTLRTSLDSSMQQSRQRKESLEESLQSVDVLLEQKVTVRDQKRQDIASELKEDGEYTTSHSNASQANERLTQNKKRFETFEEEAQEKLHAYQGNKLFTYLLQRDFNGSEYSGTAVTRKLDSWVAGIINYSEVRKNYDFLTSMPTAIKAEIDQQQADLDELVERIEAIEQEVAEKHGLPQVLSDGNDLAQKRAKILGDIQREDAQFSSYTVQRKELDNTKDAYHQRALGRLKSYLKDSSIVNLKERARATPNSEDDHLVDQVESIDAKIRQLKSDAKTVQEKQSAVAEQLEGLRQVSRHYSSNNWERNRSYFGNSLDIDDLLTGYLLGRISTDSIISDLNSHHHWEPEPAPVYHSSYSSSHHSSGGDSFGGGDFSSGGGFGGGGGFSSGGGF